MNFNRRFHVALLTVFVGAMIARVPGQANAAGIRTVALSGQHAPGTPDGIVFTTDLYGPLLNGDGQVAFYTPVTGPGVDSTNRWGIWSEFDGALTLVARAGDQAATIPAGATYRHLGAPAFNDGGRIAFYASLTRPDVPIAERLILSGTPGSLRTVARSGSQAPGMQAGVDFTGMGDPSLNSVGQTAFAASTQPRLFTGFSSGIWSEGGGSLAMVAQQGTQAPGAPPGLVFDPFPAVSRDINFRPPLISATGTTAFQTRLQSFYVDHGIWSDKTGELRLIMHNEQQVPNIAPEVYFSNMYPDTFQAGKPYLSGGGHTAFRAGLFGPGANALTDGGIWSDRGGSVALVVRDGDPAPGMPDGTTFQGLAVRYPFHPMSVNAKGELAFVAFLDGPSNISGMSVWSEGSGSLALVARGGENAPGANANDAFISFESISLNSLGQTAFLASFRDSAIEGPIMHGIWARDVLGQLQLIVREGDVLEVAPGDFRTVNSVDFLGNSEAASGRGAFNDRGQLAFRASFIDGTNGLFVSDLVAVPEPSTLALAATGLVVLLLSIRRRRK